METHRALLQIPVVHVESGCPAGVQYEMSTAEAESSAGRTTLIRVSSMSQEYSKKMY
jgi:hypothetical protein